MGNPESLIKEDFSRFHEFICYPAITPRKKYLDTQSGTAVLGVFITWFDYISQLDSKLPLGIYQRVEIGPNLHGLTPLQHSLLPPHLCQLCGS